MVAGEDGGRCRGWPARGFPPPPAPAAEAAPAAAARALPPPCPPACLPALSRRDSRSRAWTAADGARRGREEEEWKGRRSERAHACRWNSNRGGGWALKRGKWRAPHGHQPPSPLSAGAPSRRRLDCGCCCHDDDVTRPTTSAELTAGGGRGLVESGGRAVLRSLRS